MPKTEQCRLRRLMLCDGQQLEQPDHALASCLCWLEERSEVAGYPIVAAACAAERADLLARTNVPMF